MLIFDDYQLNIKISIDMMKRLVFLIILIVLIPALISGQSARKYYKAGKEFAEMQKYDDAITQYSAAIAIEPLNGDYYYTRGLTYQILKKFDEARADFEKVILFTPKDVDATISLAQICNSTGKYEEALRLLNRASGLEKKQANIYPQKVICLIGLGKFDKALVASDTALSLNNKPLDYYYRGIIFKSLNNEVQAKKEFEKSISKDKNLTEPRLALAELLLDISPAGSMAQCNEILLFNDKNTDAYLMRSRVYKKMLDYPNAINDISKVILLDPANPIYYYYRGNSYQEFNQHLNAISDYSKYLSVMPDDAEALASRAKSYEETMNFDKAIEDYTRITVLSEFDTKARKKLKEAQVRLYELNREKNPPELTLISPLPVDNSLEIRGGKTDLLVSGKIKDRSKIKSFFINKENIPLTSKNGENDFLADVKAEGLDTITFVILDDYDNETVVRYPVIRTEINPPVITITAPYTTQEGQVMLDTPVPNIAIQGKIIDESLIKSITVGNKIASYTTDEMNPVYTAILDISNINKFTIVAEDIYGNRKESEFIVNREGAGIAAGNPMGRTWVVFIENSGYETFPSLAGPGKDIGTIRQALANYQIHNIIEKKDMKRDEMMNFFGIELRDLVRKNQVKSLLVWYAGHGKFIQNVGYWIPVDAKRDDESTYYNINFLKAGLQGYSDVIIHTLVVTDACESGPGFYAAMRARGDEPTCDNSLVTGARSAQVFSSAGKELALDNSKFTNTFANTLLSNTNACIPIETIVKRVTDAVLNEKGQQPQFGTIPGLDDMNGTFFFIAK
jgi:tetratricopeptide (TPR) repeat protein